MGTQANVLLSSGERAAVICQTNQKIKKKNVLQQAEGMCLHAHSCVGWGDFGQVAGPLHPSQGDPWYLPVRLCSPSVRLSPLPESASVLTARKGD